MPIVETRRKPPVERQRAIHLPVVVGELVVDPFLQVDSLEFLDRHGPRRGRARVQDVQRARQAACACEVQVVQQRSRSRQAPGGQRRAAEFRGKPAAHPAVVRVHLAAQHYRRTEGEGDARQFEPWQGEQVQPVADDRRADHRRDDMRHDRRDDQPPELRSAMGRVVVALLLEEEDGVRRLEGIDRPGARGFRQSVQVVEDGVVGLEPVPVLLAQLVRGGIDDHHGLADRLGILHDVGRSALAPRGIAVPERRAARPSH